MKPVRGIAVFALVVTAAAVVYIVVSVLTGWAPVLGWLIQSGIHVGEFAAVVALALSGAAGVGLTARSGVGAALLGQALLTVAELVWPRDPDLGDTLFGVGPVLTGLGLVVAGIAVLRAGRRTGPGRLAPLAVGSYTLVVLLPIVITSGGPPAPAALWAICGWDVLWLLLAVSVLTAVARVQARSRATDVAIG